MTQTNSIHSDNAISLEQAITSCVSRKLPEDERAELAKILENLDKHPKSAGLDLCSFLSALDVIKYETLGTENAQTFPNFKGPLMRHLNYQNDSHTRGTYTQFVSSEFYRDLDSAAREVGYSNGITEFGTRYEHHKNTSQSSFEATSDTLRTFMQGMMDKARGDNTLLKPLFKAMLRKGYYETKGGYLEKDGVQTLF